MDGRQWLSNGIGNAFRPYLRRVRAPRRYRAIDAEADRATATGAFENPLALKTHSNPAPSSSEASELRSCCVPPANAPPLTPTAVIHPKDRPRRKGPPYRPLFEIGRNGAKPDSIVMTLSEMLAEGCYSAASALHSGHVDVRKDREQVWFNRRVEELKDRWRNASHRCRCVLRGGSAGGTFQPHPARHRQPGC